MSPIGGRHQTRRFTMGSINNGVQHNISAINANRNYNITQGVLKKSTEKLSSGYKINRAADDAAGLAISEKMRRQVRGLTQASANAQDGISVVQTAEGALQEVQDMLQRMSELTTKASNDTLKSDDRAYISQEIKALTSEIDRVQSTTAFNDQMLLDGNFTKKSLQIGSENGQMIGIDICKMDSTSLGVNGIKDLVTKTSGSDITGGISTIKAAITSVSEQRSKLGALQNRLEHTIKNLDNIAENTQSAEAEIRDTDMASEMVKFSNANILAQAGQSMLAQANQQKQGILSILG
jgi:flagellin